MLYEQVMPKWCILTFDFARNPPVKWPSDVSGEILISRNSIYFWDIFRTQTFLPDMNGIIELIKENGKQKVSPAPPKSA